MSEPAADGSSWVRLRELLLGDGGLMASLVDVSDRDRGMPPAQGILADGSPGPAQIVAEGPRVAAHREDYELIVEAIYEGYLLHYRVPRVVQAPEPDLGLLAGDRLYALGLARLVALGDVQAVAELADVITLSALAHGEGGDELADAVWSAGARAVGWGPSAEHEYAKGLLRAGSPAAKAAMRRVCEP
jgi:hypothetical protein